MIHECNMNMNSIIHWKYWTNTEFVIIIIHSSIPHYYTDDDDYSDMLSFKTSCQPKLKTLSTETRCCSQTHEPILRLPVSWYVCSNILHSQADKVQTTDSLSRSHSRLISIGFTLSISSCECEEAEANMQKL